MVTGTNRPPGCANSRLIARSPPSSSHNWVPPPSLRRQRWAATSWLGRRRWHIRARRRLRLPPEPERPRERDTARDSFGEPLPNAGIDLPPDFTWIRAGDANTRSRRPGQRRHLPRSRHHQSRRRRAGAAHRRHRSTDRATTSTASSTASGTPWPDRARTTAVTANEWNFVSVLVWTDYPPRRSRRGGRMWSPY